MDKVLLSTVFLNMLNRPGASDEQRHMAKHFLHVLIEDGEFVLQYPDKVMRMWLQQSVDHLNHKSKLCNVQFPYII